MAHNIFRLLLHLLLIIYSPFQYKCIHAFADTHKHKHSQIYSNIYYFYCTIALLLFVPLPPFTFIHSLSIYLAAKTPSRPTPFVPLLAHSAQHTKLNLIELNAYNISHYIKCCRCICWLQLLPAILSNGIHEQPSAYLPYHIRYYLPSPLTPPPSSGIYM